MIPWRLISIALGAVVAALLGAVGYVSYTLYSTTVELGAVKEDRAKLVGELNLQSEKVATLGRETAAAQQKFKAARDRAGATAATNKELSAMLEKSVTGKQCIDAMPVVNKVIEATR